MSKYSDEAITRFSLHYNCAQAVFSAYAQFVGIEKEEAFKLSCGFGGGMGRMQEICGAATAAYMLIGGKFGMTDPTDQPSKEHTYELIREFTRRFSEQNGALHCRKLLGCDIKTVEGMQYIRDHHLFETVCAKCILSSSELIEGMLFRDEIK